MYSKEERQKAVDLYIKYGKRAPAAIRELGYPDRKSLANWYKEYEEQGRLHEAQRRQAGHSFSRAFRHGLNELRQETVTHAFPLPHSAPA